MSTRINDLNNVLDEYRLRGLSHLVTDDMTEVELKYFNGLKDHMMVAINSFDRTLDEDQEVDEWDRCRCPGHTLEHLLAFDVFETDGDDNDDDLIILMAKDMSRILMASTNWNGKCLDSGYPLDCYVCGCLLTSKRCYAYGQEEEAVYLCDRCNEFNDDKMTNDGFHRSDPHVCYGDHYESPDE